MIFWFQFCFHNHPNVPLSRPPRPSLFPGIGARVRCALGPRWSDRLRPSALFCIFDRVSPVDSGGFKH